MGVSWEKALGAIFISGIIFMILSLTEFRNILIDAIPSSLKHAITAGIGLFITFIGLQNSKIIVDSPATLVTMGKLSEPMTLLIIIGIIVTLSLLMYRVQGALLIGMVVTAIIAYFQGLVVLPQQFFVAPSGLENILFSLILFCAPLAQMLASIPAATSPALIIIGFYMMNGLGKIDWNDMEEAVPAFFVMFMLPISYSVAVGIGVGFIIYPLLKILSGKGRSVHPLLYVFQILFIIQLGFLSH